ncbi:MAG: saccharopine dehydrogenase NADP-binding domain-containing protein [Candidatus Bathyarchaeia archaeon]
MRIMVLGGCGLTGSCAVRDLAETSDAEVIIGDRNFGKTVKLAEKIKSKRISVEQVDVTTLSRKEKVLFSDPVGLQEVYVTLHSEVLTLPISFKDKGVRNVDWMEGGPGFVNYQLLVNMNLASSKPIKFNITLERLDQSLLR